jgi:hypothetical protein
MDSAFEHQHPSLVGLGSGFLLFPLHYAALAIQHASRLKGDDGDPNLTLKVLCLHWLDTE